MANTVYIPEWFTGYAGHCDDVCSQLTFLVEILYYPYM